MVHLLILVLVLVLVPPFALFSATKFFPETHPNEWYSLETDASIPHARVAHMAAVGNHNGMLVFGGRSSRVNIWDTDTESSLTDTWVLRSGEWERVVESDTLSSPGPRFGSTLSPVQDHAYLVGGANRTHLLPEIWKFDFRWTSWSDTVEPSGETPLPRMYHIAEVRNATNEIVLVGGIDDMNITVGILHHSHLIKKKCIDVWLFSPLSRIWKEVNMTSTTACPSPRYLHAAHYDSEKDHLYIHGGLVPDSKKQRWHETSAELWKLDMSVAEANWNWELLPYVARNMLPLFRYDHKAAIFGNFLYLFYGKTSIRTYPTEFVVKINLVTLNATLLNGTQIHVPQPRSGMSLLKTKSQLDDQSCECESNDKAVSKDVVLIFGGETEFTSSLGTTYKDTWQFFPKTEKWERVVSNAFPPDRFGHSGTVAHGHLVQGGTGETTDVESEKRDTLYCVFAGYNPIEGFLSDLWVLRSGKSNSTIPEWTQLVPRTNWLPKARSGHTMVAMDFLDDGGSYEYLLAHGGRSSVSSFQPLFDTVAFNTSSETWINMTQSGCFISRTYHIAVALDNSYMLVFGGQGYNDSSCRDFHHGTEDDSENYPLAYSSGSPTHADDVLDAQHRRDFAASHCMLGGYVVSDDCVAQGMGRTQTQDEGKQAGYNFRPKRSDHSVDSATPTVFNYGLFGDVRICFHSRLANCNWTIVHQAGSSCLAMDAYAKSFVKGGYCFPLPRSHHTGIRVSVPKQASVQAFKAVGENPQLIASIVVFGGIVGPDPSAFGSGELAMGNDVWLLHTYKAEDILSSVWEYIPLAKTGDAPLPRWSHAATVLYGTKLFITGGYSQSQVLSDCWILDFSDEADNWRWMPLVRSGGVESISLRADHIVLPVRIQDTMFEEGIAEDGENVVVNENNGTMALIMLGGTALDLHTVDLQTVGMLVPQCYPGYFSKDFASGPCLPCPLGQYSSTNGNACEKCPIGTTTSLEGSTSSNNCSTCVTNYCNGQRCDVFTSEDGQLVPQCTCNAFMSASSRCRRLNWLVDIIIAIPIVIGLVGPIVWLKTRLNKKADDVLDLEDQVQELANVWIINEREIDYISRIDGAAPGVSSIVSKGKFRGFIVAVKKLKTNLSDDVQTQRQFRKEVRLMKNLRHANIVSFIGAGRDGNGNPFIVTEFLDRGSLSVFLQSPIEKFTIVRQLKFARDAASGMEYLHNHNPPFIHRDLKTANLLVHRDYTVKVSDFGTSLLINLGREDEPLRRMSMPSLKRNPSSVKESISEYDDGSTTITSTASYSSRDALISSKASDLLISHNIIMDANSNNYVGTPLYLSPEVWEKQKFSRASDVYAFGIVLWEIMTRESNPYPRISGPSRVLKHAVLDGNRPKVPGWVSKELGELMGSCWHHDPDRRCSFYEIVITIDELLKWERSQLHREQGLNTEYDNNYDEYDSEDDEMLDARAFSSVDAIFHDSFHSVDSFNDAYNVNDSDWTRVSDEDDNEAENSDEEGDETKPLIT
eukprot:m.13184 g.13184  ORF g.13184 m.13184 type:complete len:1496 (-) comp4121_c0_seq1:184-4671(-)